MQITDAIKTAAANPIGIGPGAWKYEVFERQTAFYTANVMHSGFAAVATDAGFLALAAVLVLILLFFANQKKEIKDRKDAKNALPTRNAQRANDAQLLQTRIAVVMILFHALFDFSLSFLSVTALLGLLAAQLLPQERIPLRKIRAVRASGAAVVLLILLIPLFSRIGITKTEYYRQIAEENFQKGQYDLAAKNATLSYNCAPYHEDAYAWAKTIIWRSPKRAEYLSQIKLIRDNAMAREQPLAKISQTVKSESLKEIETNGK
jgi:hypothetical protein